MQSKAVVLNARPVGMPKPDDFAIETMEVPAPAEGEVQVRNVCMSVDPYMRGRMVDRKSYVPPFQIGEVLTGGSIGQVTTSQHPAWICVSQPNQRMRPTDHNRWLCNWCAGTASCMVTAQQSRHNRRPHQSGASSQCGGEGG